jgi:hypothetical protein
MDVSSPVSIAEVPKFRWCEQYCKAKAIASAVTHETYLFDLLPYILLPAFSLLEENNTARQGLRA